MFPGISHVHIVVDGYEQTPFCIVYPPPVRWPAGKLSQCLSAGTAVEVARTRDLGIPATLPELRDRLLEHLRTILGYNVAPISSTDQTA